MGCEEDVLKIGKKLEKLISSDTADHASAVDMLKSLQDLPMTLEVLQKTRIGMTVNSYRKATNSDEAITLSKALIKSWKKLLPADAAQSATANNKNSKSTSNGEKESKSEDREESMKEDPQSTNETSSEDALSSSAASTKDPVRLKCRELLASALKFSDVPEGAMDPELLAASIEDNIYNEFQNTEAKYKNRVRSRVANLKDKKNPKLRENVLNGYITPSAMASMTAEEMASDDLKNIRAKYTKEAIDDHQMAKTGGTFSDLFKCGKCKKNNCTYNQVQTRSADEPMTTFVYCNECGNRWKFC